MVALGILAMGFEEAVLGWGWPNAAAPSKDVLGDESREFFIMVVRKFGCCFLCVGYARFFDL